MIRPWDRGLAWERLETWFLPEDHLPPCASGKALSPLWALIAPLGNMSLTQEDPDPQDRNRGPQHLSGGRRTPSLHSPGSRLASQQSARTGALLLP